MIKQQFTKAQLAGKSLNVLAKANASKAGKMAFEIFCTPREGKVLNKKELAFLNKAEQKDVSVHDIKVKTYHWSGGEKIVLLAHGYESNSARWRALVPTLLRHDYSVIAVDAPAHGLSGNKTVNGVLYAETLEQVIKAFNPHFAIGHSFGGMSLAYYFSTFQYQAVEKLILMATPSRLRLVIDLFFQELGLSDKCKIAMENHFEGTFGFTIDYFTVGQFINHCSIPGIIIHDESDLIAPIAEAHHIHDNWEGSKLITTTGLGHFLQSGNVFNHILDEIR